MIKAMFIGMGLSLGVILVTFTSIFIIYKLLSFIGKKFGDNAALIALVFIFSILFGGFIGIISYVPPS